MFFFYFLSFAPFHLVPARVPSCVLLFVYIQGGDKLTLNLSGGVDAPLISLSPNSPKTPSNNSNVIAPSSAATAALITFNTPPASPIFDLSANTGPAVPTGAAADLSSLDCASLLSASATNNNNSSNVTVTHFSDQRGGVVEKISVPSLNIYSHEMSSPKLDNKTRAQNNNNSNINSVVAKSNSNNPFINSPTPTTATVSTNPFLSSASGGVGVTEVERINNNNNNQVTTRNGGSRNGSVGDEDNMDNSNVEVMTSGGGGEKNLKKKKRIVDRNPFRDERGGVIGSPQMNVKVMNVEELEEDEMDRKNGNVVAEEIVTVSEIDGGRVAEIIRVSSKGEGGRL